MVPLDLLREATIFSGCTEQDLNRLRQIAVTREFQDGARIFSQGQEARELMVISSGNVQLELSVSVLGEERNITFETKNRGNIVGWSSLASTSRFTLSGRAVGRTTVAAFGRRELESLFDSDPPFGLQVMKNALSVVRLRLERTHRMWIQEIQRSLDEHYR